MPMQSFNQEVYVIWFVGNNKELRSIIKTCLLFTVGKEREYQVEEKLSISFIDNLSIWKWL